MFARANLLPSRSMNAPELADKLDREAEPAVPDARGIPTGAEMDGRAERDADTAHRRTGLVALVAAILVVALAGALYFGAGPSSSDLDKSADVEIGFAPELALPQAPGLSSASRAFSPSSALGPRADAMAALDKTTTPAEPLSEIGPRLAPEWSLALAIQADPEAFADAPPSTRGTAAQRTPAPRAETPNPQADALARVPALPADAPMSTGELASSVARTPEAGVVSTEIVHPGITRRTYTSLATILAQKVAECRQKGFLAAESCRVQVCSEHWGKVPACPQQPGDEPVILP
jgi:hypothetical protein